MARLWRGENSLDSGELLGGREHVGLLHTHRLHELLVVKLGESRAHAVEAEPAGMARRGDEVRAERVHLRKRADAAGVAVVVGILAARERRAARGLDGYDAVVRLAAQLLAHERRN